MTATFAATINGNNRNDVLEGTDSQDTIRGRGGNDRIYGYRGNDQLYGIEKRPIPSHPLFDAVSRSRAYSWNR